MIKPIKRYPGYFINKNGQIFSNKRGKVREMSSFKSSGYNAVHFSPGGKKEFIHRLLLETFCRPPKNKEVCRHLNGKSFDNRLKNLKWGTLSENQMDRVRTRTDNRGERHGLNKYPLKLVKKIREICKTKRQTVVAKELGIPQTSISYMIKTGYKWL